MRGRHPQDKVKLASAGVIETEEVLLLACAGWCLLCAPCTNSAIAADQSAVQKGFAKNSAKLCMTAADVAQCLSGCCTLVACWCYGTNTRCIFLRLALFRQVGHFFWSLMEALRHSPQKTCLRPRSTKLGTMQLLPEQTPAPAPGIDQETSGGNTPTSQHMSDKQALPPCKHIKMDIIHADNGVPAGRAHHVLDVVHADGALRSAGLSSSSLFLLHLCSSIGSYLLSQQG